MLILRDFQKTQHNYGGKLGPYASEQQKSRVESWEWQLWSIKQNMHKLKW